MLVLFCKQTNKNLTIENCVSLQLRLVAVDGARVQAKLEKLSLQEVHLPFGLGKDERLLLARVEFQLVNQTAQLKNLLRFLANVHLLDDVVVGGQVGRANVHLAIIVEKVSRQLTNLSRPRCRPHQRLAVAGNLFDNLTNLILETHVQHSVGLVEHQVADVLQRDAALAHKVQKSARTGDNHRRLDVIQLMALSILRGAAENANNASEMKTAHHVTNLLHKFSGGSQHQNIGTILLSVLVALDVHQGGQGEAERLAAARVRDGHQVGATQRQRPGDRLYARWALKAQLLDALEDVLGNIVQLVNLQDRSDHIVALDRHLILCGPIRDQCAAGLVGFSRSLIERLVQCDVRRKPGHRR